MLGDHIAGFVLAWPVLDPRLGTRHGGARQLAVVAGTGVAALLYGASIFNAVPVVHAKADKWV